MCSKLNSRHFSKLNLLLSSLCYLSQSQESCLAPPHPCSLNLGLPLMLSVFFVVKVVLFYTIGGRVQSLTSILVSLHLGGDSSASSPISPKRTSYIVNPHYQYTLQPLSIQISSHHFGSPHRQSYGSDPFTSLCIPSYRATGIIRILFTQELLGSFSTLQAPQGDPSYSPLKSAVMIYFCIIPIFRNLQMKWLKVPALSYAP